nr:hypothetical protein [Microbacterium testaceum]
MTECDDIAKNVVDLSAAEGWELDSPAAIFYVCTFHGLALGEGEAVAMGDGGATISLGTDAPSSFIHPGISYGGSWS